MQETVPRERGDQVRVVSRQAPLELVGEEPRREGGQKDSIPVEARTEKYIAPVTCTLLVLHDALGARAQRCSSVMLCAQRVIRCDQRD